MYEQFHGRNTTLLSTLLINLKVFKSIVQQACCRLSQPDASNKLAVRASYTGVRQTLHNSNNSPAPSCFHSLSWRIRSLPKL